MFNRNLAIIFPFILLFAFPVRADVPPDAGKVRVKINLITETADDLSDYRFFLDFYGDLREVEIKSPGRTEIPPMGGGVRYSSGTLYAVPQNSLKDIEEKPTPDQLNKLSALINKKEVAGAVELAQHRFSADIPKGEKAPEVYYVIKRAENTLKSERIAKENPQSSLPSVISNSPTSYVVSGVLITLAVVMTGIFAFRKRSKKV
jgi:hypothetical protein